MKMLRQKKRAFLTRGVSLQPHTTLHMGEQGTVVHVDEDEDGIYAVDILMDKHHHGLDFWDNVAHITGPELDNVKLSKQWAFPRVNVSLVAILAIGIMALISGGVIAEAVEAEAGHAVIEEEICGSYDCLNLDRKPVTLNHAREEGSYGHYTGTKGVT